MADEVKIVKPTRIYVQNGEIYRDEDGTSVKRTGYPTKIASRVTRLIRDGKEVELSAISEKAVSNMVRALVHIYSSLAAYNITPEIKGVYFRDVEIGEGDDKAKVIAKTFLIGRKS